MNEPNEAPRKWPWLRPPALLLGVVTGLTVLSWAGREVTKSDWHTNFTRFHPMISPEAMYEPTVDEMCAIVRARCTPAQVLVIVGGNSILLGVGQPADKIWTQRLQESLGDRYVVVNLAFRGASANDAGAVVAETLRAEFPREIYIANENPFQSTSPIGTVTYRFALLDAYYKGYLLPWKPRDMALSGYLKTLDYRDYNEMDHEIGAKLDSWLYFHGLWNWFSYTQHFTFATTLMPHAPEAYWPRSRFKDAETDFDASAFESRFPPGVVATDLNISRHYSSAFYHENSDGSWTEDELAYQIYVKDSRDAFPDSVKPRTLILIGQNSPFYTRQLLPEIVARDEKAIGDTIGILKAQGYAAIGYGRDFGVEDFGDRTHLTSSGGAKLAEIVAPAIESMAQKLNYLHP